MVVEALGDVHGAHLPTCRVRFLGAVFRALIRVAPCDRRTQGRSRSLRHIRRRTRAIHNPRRYRRSKGHNQTKELKLMTKKGPEQVEFHS